MLSSPLEVETKSSRLRGLIEAPSMSFLMEAHSGLSARIAEEAGFEALWASGLSISASLGVRDNNEATWTQVLDVLEFMADASSIPILVDGDTGYGDFNTMRRLVRKLETRNIAGVCIERIHPKGADPEYCKNRPLRHKKHNRINQIRSHAYPESRIICHVFSPPNNCPAASVKQNLDKAIKRGRFSPTPSKSDQD